MSYARLTQDGSDVYLFDHESGYLTCWWCDLGHANEVEHWRTTDLNEMFSHLAAHRAAGHHVPEYVEDEMRADFPDGYRPDA
jgi:hypothetical protein